MTTRGKSKDGAEKTLTKRMVDDFKQQNYYVHKLCEEGAFQELQKITKTPAFTSGINSKDDRGWTPLHAAAHGALANDTATQCRVIRFLLQNGADPTITTTTSSNTVLHLLSRVPIDKAEDNVISLLSELIIRFLEKGLKIDHPNAKSKSPLHVATSKSTVVLMAMLLQYGADPNARNHRGETPLHVAIGTADVEKVRILTNYRADPLMKADYDMTPLDLAHQQQEVIMQRVMQFALKRAEERTQAEREQAEAAAKQLEAPPPQLTDSGIGDVAPPDESALDSLVAALTDPDAMTQLPDIRETAKEQEQWQEHHRLRQKMLPSSYQTPEQAAAALAAGAAASSSGSSESLVSSPSPTVPPSAPAAVANSPSVAAPVASSPPSTERGKGSADAQTKAELRAPKVLLRTDSVRNSPPGSPHVGGSPRTTEGRDSASSVQKKDKLTPQTASKSRGGTLLTLLAGSFRGNPDGLRDAIKASSEDIAPPDDGEVLAGDSPDVLYAYNENGVASSIRAATLDKLIERLTGQQSPGQFFVNCFLLTYQRFTTPQELLQKMFKRFHDKRHRETEQARQTVQYRVLALLRSWIEGFFEDFAENNEALKPLVMDFLQNQLQTPIHKVSAMNLQRVYDKSKEAFERAKRDNKKYLEETARRDAAPPRALNILEVNVKEIAYQLTLLESDTYCQLRSRECLNQSWSSKDKATAAPNILHNIEHFNAINRWVMSEIVNQIQLKNRQLAVSRFVELARALRDLNNFNGLMEVLSGLRSAAVQRLTKTWEGLDSDRLSDFQVLVKEMSFDGNFRAYRNLLKTVGSPCLPYLGVYLTDLTFIEDGNPDIVDGLINFYKHEKIAEIVQQIQFFQDNRHQSRYLTLQRSPALVAALSNLRYMSEKEAFAQSLRIEPRDATEAIEGFLQEEIRLRAQIQDLQLQREQSDALVRELKLTVTQLTQKIKTLQSDLRVTRNIGHLALPDDDIIPIASISSAPTMVQARLDRASVRKSQMIAARTKKPQKPLPAVPPKSTNFTQQPPSPSTPAIPLTNASSPAASLSTAQFLAPPTASPPPLLQSTFSSASSSRQDLAFLPPRPIKPAALATLSTTPVTSPPSSSAAELASLLASTIASPSPSSAVLPATNRTSTTPARGDTDMAAVAEALRVSEPPRPYAQIATGPEVSSPVSGTTRPISVGPPTVLPPPPPLTEFDPEPVTSTPVTSGALSPSSAASAAEVGRPVDSPTARKGSRTKEKKEKKSSRVARSQTAPEPNGKPQTPQPATPDIQSISNTRRPSPAPAPAVSTAPSVAPPPPPSEYEPPTLSTINRRIAANETRLFPYTRGDKASVGLAQPTVTSTSPIAAPPTPPSTTASPTTASVTKNVAPAVTTPPHSYSPTTLSPSSGGGATSRPTSHDATSRRTHSGNYVIDVSDKPPPPRPPSTEVLQINSPSAAPANTSPIGSFALSPVNNSHQTSPHASASVSAATQNQQAATSPFGKSRSTREPVRTPAFPPNQPTTALPASPSAVKAQQKYATVRNFTVKAPAAPAPSPALDAKQGPRSISLRHFGVIKKDDTKGGGARPSATDV